MQMDVDVNRVEAWLHAPREALDRELKSWLDPTIEVDRAHLVKGMLALRNRNGGMIAIGFDNATGEPIAPPPKDWRARFHGDELQSLVSKHASQPFEVTVTWFNSGVGAHPVILVDGGIRSPVAVKSPVMASGKQLLPMDTVFVRTLNSNNMVSSAPASHKDWEELTRVCFENREADIGRFVRRHLTPSSVHELLATFGPPSDYDTLKDKSTALLDEGERHFQRAYARAGVKEGHEAALEWGYSAVALVVLPPPRDGETPLDMSFFDRLYIYARSSRSMVPPWHDLRSLMRRDTEPYTKEGAYEVLLDVPRPDFGHFEFSRLDPCGRFYNRSALREEVSERRFHMGDTPTLDPARAVAWVTEAFLTGAAFARSMDSDLEVSTLGFSFRWGKLLGRKLYDWSRMSEYQFRGNVVRGDDEVTAFVELPLSVAKTALAQYVRQATSPLFAAFGWQVPHDFVEHFTSEAAT